MATICKSCLGALAKPASRYSILFALPLATNRTFSVLNRPPPNYEGHVPLTRIERAGLAAGSALWSFFDPTRAGNASCYIDGFYKA
jgi:ubiquinone biosynthesis protein COQ4